MEYPRPGLDNKQIDTVVVDTNLTPLLAIEFKYHRRSLSEIHFVAHIAWPSAWVAWLDDLPVADASLLGRSFAGRPRPLWLWVIPDVSARGRNSEPGFDPARQDLGRRGGTYLQALPTSEA